MVSRRHCAVAVVRHALEWLEGDVHIATVGVKGQRQIFGLPVVEAQLAVGWIAGSGQQVGVVGG